MSSALKLQDQNRLLKEEILDMVPAAQYARTLETVNELRSRALDLENSINGFNQHFAELQVENISLKQRMEVMPKCLLLDILCWFAWLCFFLKEMVVKKLLLEAQEQINLMRREEKYR